MYHISDKEERIDMCANTLESIIREGDGEASREVLGEEVMARW